MPRAATPPLPRPSEPVAGHSADAVQEGELAAQLVRQEVVDDAVGRRAPATRGRRRHPCTHAGARGGGSNMLR